MYSTRSPIAGDAAAACAFASILGLSGQKVPQHHLSGHDLVASMTPHFRWRIAAIVEEGPPPRFGQYGGCSPMRPCVGCEDGCPSQSLVHDLQRRTRSDILLLSVGNGFQNPAWARVHVGIGQSRALSGVTVPIIEPWSDALSLVMLESGFALIPERDGLVVKKVWQPAAMLEAQAHVFLQRLSRLREAVLSAHGALGEQA